MKVKSVFFSMILFVAFLGFQSCSSDDSDEPDANANCANFQASYEQVTEALMAYSNNPSTANCEAYKNAILDFYQDFNDCSYWGNTYQDAYDDLQGIDCSGAD